MQVLVKALEFAGAPIKLVPKLDYLQRKITERRARPNSAANAAAATNGVQQVRGPGQCCNVQVAAERQGGATELRLSMA